MPRLAATLLLAAAALPAAPPEPTYVKKGNRPDTLVATLKASGLPALDGKWYLIGPFDNTDGTGFDAVYPPEREIDLAKKYPGKGGEAVAWQEFRPFRLGRLVDLARFKDNDDSAVYLMHEFESSAPGPVLLPLSLGSDDGIAVWLNGERMLANDTVRAAAPDQERVLLKLRPGTNRLLIKVTNRGGEWKVYVQPELPNTFPPKIIQQLDRDFPDAAVSAPSPPRHNAEAKHYRISTVPVPAEVVLEVGGLAFRPDGKLYACTRRGEVWLITHPESDDPNTLKFRRFAAGLHEALGLSVEGNNTLYVVQRPELTKLVDRDGDGAADEFVTVCDRWGVSGDYHEFAFGPARDRQGNFYVTLNVGFSGGHQSKAPWRGWCLKVTPSGELEPYACGLRSPNGVAFSPEGELFYTDNQGEWVATNKLHHVRKGEFYGHPAGLRWRKDSPFADKLPDPVVSGMLYDGQKGNAPAAGYPNLTPPCVWFPYGRMGQSASEPCWDTTGGKFGPFAGQLFVGDQTRSMIMRVDLQKVNGRYQGACFPFVAGFQCGVNRLAFGPDGTLYVGETNRGWGSLGGKPYGLQRLTYTGALPCEIHTMRVTKGGFELSFTKPLDSAKAKRLEGYGLQSFTYHYWGTYGCPEIDPRAEKVGGVKLSPDRRTVTLAVDGLRKGRVYELRISGVVADDGDPVLHPEAYYTLNELP
jgi:glucose/arabinose dehydrogenase